MNKFALLGLVLALTLLLFGCTQLTKTVTKTVHTKEISAENCDVRAKENFMTACQQWVDDNVPLSFTGSIKDCPSWVAQIDTNFTPHPETLDNPALIAYGDCAITYPDEIVDTGALACVLEGKQIQSGGC